MIISNRYTSPTKANGAPCPFCGQEVTMHPAQGSYDLHHFYCNKCLVEFTIDERVRDYQEERVRNVYLDEAIDRWNTRVKAQGDECPFCGEKIHEWPWGHGLFDILYCPSCKKRFEFQSHSHSKNSMRRTMREFSKRP